MTLLMTLLLTLLLKSLLVFAAAALLLLILRRSSAAARHLVCLLTLGAVLLLPLFSLSLPGWHLPVLAVTQSAEPTPYQEPTPVRPSPALPKEEGKEFKQEAHSVPAASSSASASASSPLGRTPAKQGGGFLFLYLLGLLLASARPLLGLWGVRRLSRACAAVADAPTLSAAADCARLLGFPVLRLCRADVPVPMTWGWRRPVIVLPLASAGWPEDRLRSVLLHEMAHVRRRDWLCHRFADFACAVYWFHPLVWLTARRLRAESELACDDLVLASGIPAPDYARHLLEIASALPRVPSRSHAAIAMAQTSHIESRLTMILDKTRSRRTVARRALLFALIPGTAALVTLAVLRPDAKAQTAPAQPASSATAASPNLFMQWQSSRVSVAKNAQGELNIATSSDFKINGTTLFAGVTDANKPGSPWWSASGTVLPTPVYDTNAYHAENHASPDKYAVSFAFRLPASAQDTTVRYELPQSTQSSSDGFWPTKIKENTGRTESQMFAKTNGTRIVTAEFPTSLLKTNIRVGIASGAWKPAATYAPAPGGFGNIEILPATAGDKFLFSPVSEAKDGAIQSVATNAAEDIRIVAVDTQGKETLPVLIGDNGGGGLTQITAHFGLPLSQIKEIRVETRPFQWVEYKDVALKPVQ